MSDYLVQISAIAGESQLIGYEGQVECLALRHAIDLPVVARGASRVEGTSRHGAIELDHTLDMASPSLRHALSAGTNLGQVVITRMSMAGGEARAVETVTLADVYVVRVDVDTPLNTATGRPGEDLIETFSLEYSEIRWDQKKYVNGVEAGSVQGGWSNTSQSTV